MTGLEFDVKIITSTSMFFGGSYINHMLVGPLMHHFWIFVILRSYPSISSNLKVHFHTHSDATHLKRLNKKVVFNVLRKMLQTMLLVW